MRLSVEIFQRPHSPVVRYVIYINYLKVPLNIWPLKISTGNLNSKNYHKRKLFKFDFLNNQLLFLYMAVEIGVRNRRQKPLGGPELFLEIRQ